MDERLWILIAAGTVTFGAAALAWLCEPAEPGPPRSGVRCPHCGWQPRVEALWVCAPFPGCGAAFDAFASRGACTGCQKQWSETSCCACDRWSPHEAWYGSELQAPAPGAHAPPQVQRVAGARDRCPFCHDRVAVLESVACSACLARHHADCWDGHGACGACGCDVRYGSPEATEAPPRPRRADPPTTK